MAPLIRVELLVVQVPADRADPVELDSLGASSAASPAAGGPHEDDPPILRIADALHQAAFDHPVDEARALGIETSSRSAMRLMEMGPCCSSCQRTWSWVMLTPWFANRSAMAQRRSRISAPTSTRTWPTSSSRASE